MSAIDLAHYLRKRMKVLNLSLTGAAGKSGISRQTWHKLLNAEIEEAKLSTLIQVANTLEIHTLNMLRVYFHGKCLSHYSTQSSGTKQFATGFVADVTYPDNSTVNTGQEFEKIWEVVNLGLEPWSGWRLQCVDEQLQVGVKQGCEHFASSRSQYGLLPLETSVPIPDTLPGEHTRIAVRFRAPDFPCTVISHWKSMDAHGVFLFPNLTGLYCLVKVVSL